MVDELEGSLPVEVLLEELLSFGDSILDGDALVRKRSGNFGPHGLAVRCKDADIGKGAAHIDTQLVSLDVAHGVKPQESIGR